MATWWSGISPALITIRAARISTSTRNRRSRSCTGTVWIQSPTISSTSIPWGHRWSAIEDEPGKPMVGAPDNPRKEVTMFRKLIFAVACILLLTGAPAVQAACLSGFAFLDLKTGTAYSTLGANVSFHTFPGVVSGVPAPVPAAGCSGWKMAALRISIPGAPNACTQANIVVEYEGTPKLWSTDLGDSPTNDGFAGDAGTTNHAAELWVLDENLSLAPANMLAPFGLTIDNPLVVQHL